MRLKLYHLSFNEDTDFLKLLAAFTMLLDHFGKIFSREMIILQVVGRISFPLFAYCIAIGASRTGNIKKYMTRLALTAILSQPVYILAFQPWCRDISVFISYKNAVFSLLAGLAGIYCIKERNWLFLAVLVFIATFTRLDYGIYGFTLILAFYVFRDNVYLSLAVVASLITSQFFLKSNMDLFGKSFGMNVFGLTALPFIYISTNFGVRVNKYFFYIFYPAHLLFFFIVQIL